MVPVSARDPSKFQHQGFGMLLMEEAERIAREEHGSHKISVISGNVLLTHIQVYFSDSCLIVDIQEWEHGIIIVRLATNLMDRTCRRLYQLMIEIM